LQVGQVTLHVDREHLSPAIARYLVPERVAGQHQAGVQRGIAFPDDIFLRPELDHAIRKVERRLPVGTIEGAPLLEFRDH
jgi:hypothetical protein